MHFLDFTCSINIYFFYLVSEFKGLRVFWNSVVLFPKELVKKYAKVNIYPYILNEHFPFMLKQLFKSRL